ncbi:ribonuclease H-like domain-containing protein [Tanacetum coccineum]|uniref:Ribonuclease H-like domain-containing protein n=1 Tax=Tanacetum coccineum TaxID=301880 RepID=A0ABQ5HCR5_9ASTR
MLLLFHKAKAILIKLSLVLTVTIQYFTPSTSSTNIPKKEALAGFADGISMIAIRMKKFYKKTGRRVRVDGKTPVGFDKKKLECFNCHNTGHFAREYTAKGTHDEKKKRDSFLSTPRSRKAREELDGLADNG